MKIPVEVDLPPTLQSIYFQLWNRTACDNLQVLAGSCFNMAMICGSFGTQGGIDTCQGDSGGPAVCFKAGHFVQQGIVSIGLGCGEPYQAGYYTNVCQIMDWIKQETNNTIYHNWFEKTSNSSFIFPKIRWLLLWILLCWTSFLSSSLLFIRSRRTVNASSICHLTLTCMIIRFRVFKPKQMGSASSMLTTKYQARGLGAAMLNYGEFIQITDFPQRRVSPSGEKSASWCLFFRCLSPRGCHHDTVMLTKNVKATCLVWMRCWTMISQLTLTACFTFVSLMTTHLRRLSFIKDPRY